MHYAIVRHHQWWFTISITLWILANDWLSTHCSQIVSYVNCVDLVFVPLTWSDSTIALLKLHRFLKIIRKQQDICAWMWARAEEVASCLASTFVFVFIFVFIFLFVFVFVFVFLFVFVFVFGWITRAEEVAPPWHPHLSKTRWVARYFPTLHGNNLPEIYLFIHIYLQWNSFKGENPPKDTFKSTFILECVTQTAAWVACYSTSTQLYRAHLNML